jgi:pantoate--beta-alanine ligase
MPRAVVSKLPQELQSLRIVKTPVTPRTIKYTYPSSPIVKYRSTRPISPKIRNIHQDISKENPTTASGLKGKPSWSSGQAGPIISTGDGSRNKRFQFSTMEDSRSSAVGSALDIAVTRDVDELRHWRNELRLSGRRVGFVPTMGALHEGHLKLLRRAAARNHEVYISIYVNPTQFGLNEDLSSYPRTWDEDLKKIQALNEEMSSSRHSYLGRVTTIFNPSSKTMYPTLPPTSELDGHGSFVEITPLSRVLEGASRPVFFRGVATVVMKLLNIVQPDQVFFGQKDIQQALVIRRMIKDFHLDIDMKVVETERDSDGLALSSRNVYLGDRRRKVGLVLDKTLNAGYMKLEAGSFLRSEILEAALECATEIQDEQRLLLPSQRARFEFDYLSLADPDTLQEIEVVSQEKGAIFSGAVIMLPLEDPQEGEDIGLGNGATPVRLIDNRILFSSAVFSRSKSGERSLLLDRERNKGKTVQESTGDESPPVDGLHTL